MTQSERILEYIHMFGSISQLEAARDLGCYRLAARIHDLKNQGHEFSDRMESAENRFGEQVSFKRYSKA